MRRLAFRLLGSVDAIEDALQEAYSKAFRALGSFREDAEFGSWLYRVTYNACLDELRRARRRPLGRATIDDVESFASGPEQAVATADAVRTALAALPVEQRATVVLVDGEGFDNQAAARLLGVAPGTVASRLSRARTALRRALEEVDDDRASRRRSRRDSGSTASHARASRRLLVTSSGDSPPSESIPQASTALRLPDHGGRATAPARRTTT